MFHKIATTPGVALVVHREQWKDGLTSGLVLTTVYIFIFFIELNVFCVLAFGWVEHIDDIGQHLGL